MTWSFFTNRYKYNVDQICYIYYIHLISLEAGIFLISRQIIIYTETLRRTISFLFPDVAFRSLSLDLILCCNPSKNRGTLLKTFLGLFCSYSGNNQDCLLCYSPDISFSSVSFSTVKRIPALTLLLKNMFQEWRWSLPAVLSPSTAIILFPLVVWTLPRSLFEGQSELGLHYGVQPFSTPMWFGTKIYFTSSPYWQWPLQIFMGKLRVIV